jgi:hypothetical protein
MMAVTVLDSGDMPAILADAGVEVSAPKPSAATESKKGDEGESAGAQEGSEDPDDIEGEDGLTPRQKREWTSSMQKSLGKKHRKQMEAEEFAADQYNQRKLADARAEKAERELAELRSKSAAPVETPKAPEKPQRANFASEEAFVDAMIQFGVDQRLAEKAEEDKKAREKRERELVIQTAQGRIDRAIELVPDFETVLQNTDDSVIVPPMIAGYMQESELLAELTYHFAKNPDVLVSLSKLSPSHQLVKIGKIESTLTPFEAKKPQDDSKSSKEEPNGEAPKPAPSADTTGIDLRKPRGKAAPVITPLDGTGSAGASKDSRDMTAQEAIEDYSKNRRVNLGMRKRH